MRFGLDVSSCDNTIDMLRLCRRLEMRCEPRDGLVFGSIGLCSNIRDLEISTNTEPMARLFIDAKFPLVRVGERGQLCLDLVGLLEGNLIIVFWAGK